MNQTTVDFSLYTREQLVSLSIAMTRSFTTVSEKYKTVHQELLGKVHEAIREKDRQGKGRTYMDVHWMMSILASTPDEAARKAIDVIKDSGATFLVVENDSDERTVVYVPFSDTGEDQ